MNESTHISDALNVRIQHAIYNQVLDELTKCIEMAGSFEGTIVPLLGPTRIGKTDLIKDASERLGKLEPGPGVLTSSWSYGFGSIPPKPSDRELYASMLRAIGYDCGPREKTSQVRDRLLTAIRDEGVKVIAMDECNHCAETGANLSPRGATDHFKAVVDATGVTLILSGLPKFQKLIDENEQFRDRSTSTILFRPYSWSEQQDRDGFAAAVLGAFQLLQETGAKIEFEDLDMVRRLFGISGGRIGLVMRVLKAACVNLENDQLTFSIILKAARSITQEQLRASEFLDPNHPPTDVALTRAYVSVLGDAGMAVKPKSIDEFAAARFPEVTA